MENGNQYAKSKNDALKVRPVKSSKSLLEYPQSLCLLLPSTQKSLIARNCWNPTWLAGTWLLTATGKPTQITTIEIIDKTHGLRFSCKNHVCFFLSVLKKTNTLHLYSMCGGIKTLKQGWAINLARGRYLPTPALKHNVRTTLQVAYHGCKNLTHCK